MEMKKCSKCGTDKPLTNEFYFKSKIQKSGFRPECKDCSKKQKKEHYKNNEDKMRERSRKYCQNNKDKIKGYKEKNKDRIKEKNEEWKEKNKEYFKEYRDSNKDKIKEYCEKNKDKIKERTKEYCEKNKDKIKEYKKEHFKSNKDLYRRNSQTRRARKKQLPATLTFEQWQKIKNIFNNKCAYCGKESKLEQEHFIPLSKGGEYTHNNIIPACRSCNSSKHNNFFSDWYHTYKHYNKKREKFILDFLGYRESGEQQLKII